MSDRFDQLELRRRQLLLRSERLRAEFGADQRIVLDAIGGVDRIFGMARSVVSPMLLAGGGALLFGMLKRVRPVGFAMRGLVWVSLARKLLTVFTLVRAATRSRSPPVDGARFPGLTQWPRADAVASPAVPSGIMRVRSECGAAW